MKDTYQMLYGDKDPNSSGWITGKPLSQGGIDGRTEATGLGVFYGTRYLLNNPNFWEKYNLKEGIEGKKIIIQGFGNVGSYAAHFFSLHKAKIIGII